MTPTPDEMDEAAKRLDPAFARFGQPGVDYERRKLEFTMRAGFDGWYEVEQNGEMIAKFLVRGDAAMFMALMKEVTQPVGLFATVIEETTHGTGREA